MEFRPETIANAHVRIAQISILNKTHKDARALLH